MNVRRVIFHPLFPVILSLLIFGPFLNDYFWADDLVHIEKVSALSSSHTGNLFSLWKLSSEDISAIWYTPDDLVIQYIRPLVNLLFLTDLTIWGFNPSGFHLTNLLLHLATVFAVFLLGMHILGEKQSAFIASMLFLLYPGHLEAVWWISGRTELASSLLYLLSIWFFVRGAISGRTTIRTLLLAGMTLCFCLALLAKETSATLPVTMLLLDYLILKKQGTGYTKSGMIPHALLWVVLLGYCILRLSFGGGIGNPPASYYHNPLSPAFPLLALRKCAFYLMHTVFFLPMDSVFGMPFWHDHRALLVLFALLAGTVLAVLFIHLRRERSFLFLLLWFPVTLSPSLLVFLGQRFLYLPSFAWCMAIALFYRTLRKNERFRLSRIKGAILPLCFSLYTLITLAELGLFHTSAERLEHSVQQVRSLIPGKHTCSDIFLIDLWAPLALGIAPALRLENDDPSMEVHALTLDPAAGTSSGRRSIVTPYPANGIALELEARDPPYLSTPAEAFFLWGGPYPVEGQYIHREEFTVQIQYADRSGLKKLLVTFHEEIESGGICILQFTPAAVEMIPPCPHSPGFHGHTPLTGDST
jgi:hypothetical protein